MDSLCRMVCRKNALFFRSRVSHGVVKALVVKASGLNSEKNVGLRHHQNHWPLGSPNSAGTPSFITHFNYIFSSLRTRTNPADLDFEIETSIFRTMSEPTTVYILGAGCSVNYGYPLAKDFIEK